MKFLSALIFALCVDSIAQIDPFLPQDNQPFDQIFADLKNSKTLKKTLNQTLAAFQLSCQKDYKKVNFHGIGRRIKLTKVCQSPGGPVNLKLNFKVMNYFKSPEPYFFELKSIKLKYQ